MKRLSIMICCFYFLAGIINGQVKSSGLPAAEERKAKNLAVSFFNRFQETRDLAPLIKKYFVKDFTRRLKFCNMTGECGGRFRDFWGKREDLIAVNATETDSQRIYISAINKIFLYFRSIQYLNDNYPQKMSDSNMEAAAKNIETKLNSILKNDPRLIKFNPFDDSDEEEENNSGFKRLDDLRRFLNDNEKFISALRLVETKLRNNFINKKPAAKIFFSPADFQVSVEENYNRFFDYPVGTRMIEIWCKSDSLFFVMDLIKENGKLKIVAIYIPMD